MTHDRTLVIVGASLAGAKAAEGARHAGFDGRIALIGKEDEAPYERPQLSKAVLRGESSAEATRLHDDGYYEANSIELLTGRRVTSLDVRARQIALDDGTVLPFTSVVLATGAMPRPLGVPRTHLEGVHRLRTVDDARMLGDAIRGARRVAVIGAGWIGSEVAASARQLGAEVVLIDSAPVPLHQVLGDQIGAVFGELHADHGVQLRLGRGVIELCGETTVEKVMLSDGTAEEADTVVIGVGVVPRKELAVTAGLVAERGILVDAQLRTSAPGVYAAGDVASAWHPHYGRHIRVEHWANALHQGLTAGANAVGGREPYSQLPYFFSDQYDLALEYVGHATPGDEMVVRGSLSEREFIAFWHCGGIVTAAMNVNVRDVLEDLKSVVSAGQPIGERLLRDSDVPLSDLVRPRGAAPRDRRIPAEVPQ